MADDSSIGSKRETEYINKCLKYLIKIIQWMKYLNIENKLMIIC